MFFWLLEIDLLEILLRFINKFFKLVNFVLEGIIKLFLENLGVFFVKFLY